MDEGADMDPIITGAVAKAGEVGMKAADSATKEAFSLLSRLLGPSADVIGEDWADRLRHKNMTRLLEKTEKHAQGKAEPGWAQPRVAAAIFEAAQYANDEIVTDYLSGVLASSREPDGGTDDALPWSSLVSRLSALQLRTHYVFYSNLRQIASVTRERKRIFDLETTHVAISLAEFLPAVGLDPGEHGLQRLSDALQGLKQEDLVGGFGYGDRDFWTDRYEKSHPRYKLRGLKQKRRVLETPFEEVLQISFTPFGVQLFLWGLGHGTADDTDYFNPDLHLVINESDPSATSQQLNDIDLSNEYWVEYEMEEDSEDPDLE